MSVAKSSHPTTVPDEELVRRASKGDAEAAGRLAARYQEAMVRYCYCHLGNVADAEDTAQDVLAKLMSTAQLPAGPFRPWLYRVARNQCLNVLKRRKGAPTPAGSFLHDSQRVSPRTGPRTAALRDEARENVRRLLASLSANDREVLILRYFEGLARAEVAAVLDLPESVVKSRLFEAMQRVKKHLPETESGP